MKKALKAATGILLLAAMMGTCCVTTSCSSSKSSGEAMYSRKQARSAVVNRNVKVRGNNKNNNSTYRTY